jgi:RND superfamily putative drug exporter
LTPALLCVAQRWAFWPDVRRERISPEHGWIPSSSSWALLTQDPKWTRRIWEWIARVIERRPATVFVATIALMAPFAVVGVLNYNRLSYGLLSELRPDVTSVVGAEEVKEHFPAGMTGVTSVLLRHPEFRFAGTEGISGGERFAEGLTDRLWERSGELGLVDVRSQDDPLGIARAGDIRRSTWTRGPVRIQAQREYVSTQGPLAGQVVRIDLVFDVDPFSRETIGRLTQAEAAVHEALREMASAAPDDDEATASLYESLPDKTEVLMLGGTASLRQTRN